MSRKSLPASIAVARRFTSDLRPHALRLAGVGAASLAVAALDLLRPWPIKWVFDGALAPVGEPSDSPGRIVLLACLAAMGIVVLYACIQYVRQITIANVGHQVTRSIRYRVFSHLSFLSPLFHARHKSGDLLVRLMGDAPMVTTMVVDSSVELATRAVLVVATVVVMVALDPLLAFVALAVLPVVYLVVRWISGHIHIAVRKQRRKESDMADYLHEAIAATETIQALGGSKHVVRRFARTNRRTARAGLKAKRLAARMSATVETLLGVALAGALALGSFRVLRGHLTPGELLVFISYVRSLLKPLRSASKHAERIAKGTACGERILGILDHDDRVISPAEPQPVPATPKALAFDRVSFGYERDTPVLREFDATFKSGELSALVGRNGAGKSTAASLALRLFDPQTGTVRLDDTSVDRVDPEELRRRVGLCLQRTDLFGDTIRENMLVGDPDADDEAIWRALEEAGADEFVRTLPGELDARLGANGAGLSGGQAGRLSLARTLLRDPAVLIVDEPFAGLDRPAVEHVADVLRRLARSRIVVVIAHDSANLDVYDRIVFMEGGVNAAEGTHRDLLSSHPRYRDVVRAAATVS